MTQNDAKKFAEIMAYLGIIFGKELTAAAIKIYFTTLNDLPIEEIQEAAVYIANNRTITGTFPLPAEFRLAKQESIEDKAEIAWTALLWAIEHVGSWPSVQFDDPVLHDVVKILGGWLRVCSADGDIYNTDWHTANLTWRRKDFLSLYRIMAKNDTHDPYLIGEQQAANSGRYDNFIPEITRITGKPGNYQAIPHDRPKELPRPKDFELVKRLGHEKISTKKA